MRRRTQLLRLTEIVKPRAALRALAAGLLGLWGLPAIAGAAEALSPRADPRAHGAIRGRVVVEGSRPAPVLLRITRDRRFCGDEKISPRVTLSPEGGVQGAVVVVEGLANTSRSAGLGEVVLDNRACEFVPHVQTARVGQTLVIRNRDPFLHTAHVYLDDGRTWFNLALPPWRRPIRRRLDRPGLLRIECNVHAWKWAFVYVSPHPFVSTTDGSGEFRIGDLSPGTHALRVWHEALGVHRRTVTVEAGQEVEVRVGLRIDDRPATDGAGKVIQP